MPRVHQHGDAVRGPQPYGREIPVCGQVRSCLRIHAPEIGGIPSGSGPVQGLVPRETQAVQRYWQSISCIGIPIYHIYTYII